MNTQRITDTLRRAEFELAMAGEQCLADQVASIRHSTCALVNAVQREHEAPTALTQRQARRDVTSALADLSRAGAS